MPMQAQRAKRVVERERNKVHYRFLHVPIWLWVFFVLPGHLTYDLYLHGPDRRHLYWLVLVAAVCAWRGLDGRLPGVEPRPYITHYGADQPNLPYRVVCYTAAWIDLLVPFTLNFIGLVYATLSGRWVLGTLYAVLYYPLALAVAAGTALDWTPRARRSTIGEGVEKAWFYVAIWTVVPAQVAAWGAWRLGARIGVPPESIDRFRLSVFLAVAGLFYLAGWFERLPRTGRYRPAGNRKP